jgi:gas vesicle protein
MKNASKILLAFIIGALSGAATGLLLAPEKGKVTRKKIKDSMDDLGEKAKDTINDLSEKTKETINDLSERAKKAFNKEQVNKNEEKV